MKNVQNKRTKKRNGHVKAQSYDIDAMQYARQGLFDYDATTENSSRKVNDICIVQQPKRPSKLNRKVSS